MVSTTKLPPISEVDFMTQVTDLAEILGWTWVHWRPARTVHGWRTPVSGPLGKGWPDLFLARVRDQRVLLVECKRDGGRLTADQQIVEDLLRDCGLTVCVWMPRDWDTIVEVLR